MHRFYLPGTTAERGGTLWLREGEAHHALRVLRLRPGDEVVVLNGTGGVFECVVEGADRRSVELRVMNARMVPPFPYRVTLFQSVIKGKAMDYAIQKATELGTFRIAPVLTARSVAQVEEENAESRAAKWETIAIESIKQCGSPWLPRIERPRSFSAWMAAGERFDLVLIGAIDGSRRHPRDCFDDFRRRTDRRPADLAVWIGPEGDFTAAEREAVLAGGGQPVTFGPLVLRSETAAVHALSIIHYEMQAP